MGGRTLYRQLERRRWLVCSRHKTQAPIMFYERLSVPLLPFAREHARNREREQEKKRTIPDTMRVRRRGNWPPQ